MNILSLFVVVPVVMILLLFLSKNIRQIRAVMVTGASALMILAATLIVLFIKEKAAYPDAEMLFVSSTVWYAPLNITYAVGVDGISVLMLLLCSCIHVIITLFTHFIFLVVLKVNISLRIS